MMQLSGTRGLPAGRGAACRAGFWTAPTPTGRIAITQAEIARAIGTAREVISRRLDALSRTGAIGTRRGEVLLLDRDALRRIAEDMAI